MSEVKNTLISENPVHLIYLKKGKTPTVVKRLNSPFPSDDLIAQLKNEYVTLNNLNIPGIRSSLNFIESNGNFGLELEYIEGQSLNDLTTESHLSTLEVLKIISNFCTILGNLHQAGWIHGSISSTNIIVHPSTLLPTLIDASLMMRFSLKASSQFSEEKLKRILPYMSPEQTGRTSRVLDYRTDFYSLGVMLYEIIVGKKPFQSEDSLELIYSHLARNPVEPARILKALPEKLSEIIMKLLAKNAEDRYQSAYGLKYDIDRIISSWEKGDEVNFTLGEKDFSGTLHIPQRLYGREKAVEKLLQNLDFAHRGNKKTVLISGDSGTGKSAIVQEVRKPITGNKGFYIQGKFDQFARNIPYSAWIEIFIDFINQLLITDEVEIQKWRNKLKQSLGSGIGVLANLIPNLRYIMLDLPEVDEVGVTESQNRLNTLLIKFFTAIASEEHPLVVFIDDLQWADHASLNLLKTLTLDTDSKYLLIIGAYRSDEVSDLEFLKMKLEEVKKSEVEIEEITLGNLDRIMVNELISDTLNASLEDTEEIAGVIYRKTQGNPYFTSQFVYSLYDEKLIQFDWEESIEAKMPIWSWDLPGIQSKLISQNVVQLLVSKIVELSPEVLNALKLAACVGNSFMLEHLSTVLRMKALEVADLLDIAVNEGYIFYKNVNQIHRVREGMDVKYQFAHDRVQQAFYSLIPDEEKAKSHFEIGQLLFKSLNEKQVEDQIFQLVFHLNFGASTISDKREKLWLAELNLKAGKEAKKIIAFDTAYDHMAIAASLINEEIWQEDEQFAISLGRDMLDCLYLTHRIEEAETYFNYLQEKIPDTVRKAELHYNKMVQYQHLSKIDQIMDIGLDGLALLGYRFNPNTNMGHLMLQLVKTYFLVRKISHKEFRNLPEMTDPETKIAMLLISKTLTFAYDRSEELMAVLGMKLLQLTVKKGNHEYSSNGFSTYGGMLAVGFNNYDASYDFCLTAINAAERTPNKAAISMAHFGLGMTGFAKISHDEALEQFDISRDMAMEGGAHTDAAPSTMYFFFINFLKGKRLNELYQIVLENVNFTAQIKTDNFHLILLAAQKVVEELKGQSDIEFKKSGEVLSNITLEEQLLNTEHKSIRIYARIFQMHNHILFGRYQQAQICESEVMDVLNVTLGTILGPYFHYLRSILYAKLYSESNGQEKRRIKKLIKGNLKKIDHLAKLNPNSFLHWSFTLKAEYAKIKGQFIKAQQYYDEAIDTAKNGNYLHEVGLANYLCAGFNSEIGNEKIADYYISEAIAAFYAWGAEAVVRSLSTSQVNKTPSSISFKNKTDKSFDLESLMKLSQYISVEIDFVKLMKQLMHVFTENAGAEKAVLLLKNNEKWFIEAQQTKNEEVIISRMPFLESNDEDSDSMIVSKSICQYVMRTREMIIIEDATTDERFAKVPYVLKYNPRSILCMPLIKKGDLTGLVYMENSMMTGAFKTDRTQMLSYISSQIAVSVENAKLYSDMIKLNQAYERFVPKEFLQMLGKRSIVDVKLGDQVQMNMTVLFADIRDFTGMSERMNPADNFKFINEFLGRMEPIIRKYHGFVDKYIGDEIMALFPTNADDAVQCAIAMMHELNVYGDAKEQDQQPSVKIGIGINTGSLMLGTVGGEDRMNSTVISDVVNIASRVEKDTKGTGAPIMITQSTFENLQNQGKYAVRLLGTKMYRGKSEETVVYEVFDCEAAAVVKAKKSTKSIFEQAVRNYGSGNYQQALDQINQVLIELPEDLPTLAFKKQIIEKVES